MIFGLTGFAQSGKDSAAKFLVEEHGFRRLAFADALRDAVYALNPIAYVNAITEYDYSGNSCWGFGAKPPIKGFRAQELRVKDLVDLVGWDRAKVDYPEVRALLQRMGTEVARELWSDTFWVDRVAAQIYQDPTADYVITDVRFANEAMWLQENGGILVRIARPGVEPVNSHVSDMGISGLAVNYQIWNDDTLETLGQRVGEMVEFYHGSVQKRP